MVRTGRNFLMRIRIIAATLLAATTLGGCMGSTAAESNRSLDSIHQPVVSVNSYVLDADAASGMLAPVEMRRVSDWLDAMEVGYGDRVSVDESAAFNSRAARDAIAMLIARKGLLLADHAPVTSGAIAPGSVRVVITRATARVDGCPNWDTRTSNNWQNSTTSNYGCATNSNLAAMVADPNDLVAGEGTGVSDPLTASRAIGAYRNAPASAPSSQGSGANSAPSSGASQTGPGGGK
jgi:pilus assembly protein CpaD